MDDSHSAHPHDVSVQIEKSRAAAISVLSNSLLVAGKLAIGLAIGSVSVVSEAIHSAVDLLAALIAWLAVRLSGRPADAGHPFGHGKIENLSGTIEALLIVAAAIWIIIEAVARLRHPEPMGHGGLGAAIMAVSAVANWLVSRHLFNVGTKTDSVALIADAWHLRTDVYTSLGVMVGLLVMVVAGWFLPGVDLGWIDPVAAILVALLILHAAWELTLSAGRDLVDAALPEAEIAALRTAAAGADPQVRRVLQIRARKAGAQRQVEITVALPGDLTVEASHAIADRVEAAVAAALPGTISMVHIEPDQAAE